MASSTQLTQQPSDSGPLDKYLLCKNYNLTLKLVHFQLSKLDILADIQKEES